MTSPELLCGNKYGLQTGTLSIARCAAVRPLHIATSFTSKTGTGNSSKKWARSAKETTMIKPISMICAALATLACMGPAAAQQSPPAAVNQTQNIKRIPLQRFEVPGTAYETVIGIAEIAPNVGIGRHTHPGPESGYLIEGQFELLIDGEQPRMLKAGDSYVVPPNTVHDAKTGAAGAKVLATYVVEKGKPLASPVK